MTLKKDGKTYYTLEETEQFLAEKSKVYAKQFANEVVARQKSRERKNYV